MDKISITFVDGFSGGGKYLLLGEERPGSPFVLLESVRLATERLNANRQKPLVIDAHFYFIDSSKGTLAYLEEELHAKGFGKDIQNGRIQLMKGKFETLYQKVIDSIRERHRAGRSVFVLDQKGWSAVQFNTIRRILHDLERSEVILTFAVDWLTAYLNESDEFGKAMLRVGIDGTRLRKYVEAKGVEGYQYVIPRLLLQDIREATGAQFFTPFFLRSQSAARDLWIIHLSKIMTARNVMVSSHWQVGNSSLHRGTAGLDMLGFDPHWEDGVALDFGFDAHAKAQISEAMIAELPYKIEKLKSSPVTAFQLMEMIANDTAATRDQIKGSLSFLHNEKQIDIINHSGKRKRHGSQIQANDYVRVSEQPMFFGLGSLARAIKDAR